MQAKRFIALVWVMTLGMLSIFAQRVTVAQQDFDGSTGQLSFSSVTTGQAAGWTDDAALFTSGSKSKHVNVPNLLGDVIMLESGVIDVTQNTYPPNGKQYVQLRFKHICKISSDERVSVEIKRESSSLWEPIDAAYYQGKAANYSLSGFNSSSYPVWNNAIATTPDNTWWQEEIFDISHEVGYELFRIRFVIQRGTTIGTNIAYGWNIDDVLVIGDDVQMKDPVALWHGAHPTGNLQAVGPYTVSASIKTSTSAHIVAPYLAWEQTYNSVTVTDSVLMNYIGGTDSVWSAQIPAFLFGTSVVYHIIASDATNNSLTLEDSYTIALPGGTTDNAAAMQPIAMADTVVTSSSVQTPIVVCVKNKGALNLTTAQVNWSVNGVVNATPYAWTGNLPWDFNQTDTVGYYNASVNKKDTIVVWIDDPNGVTDVITSDDTAKKVIYGSSDLVIKFVSLPNDTVFATGPHEVKIHVRSMTNQILASTYPLDIIVQDTDDVQVDAYSITMTALGDGEYTAFLQNIPFKHNAIFSVSIQDVVGNTLSIIDTTFINFPKVYKGTVIIGTATTNSSGALTEYFRDYSWSRQIYENGEILADAADLTITKVAFQWNSTTARTYQNQICFMKAVPFTTQPNNQWSDPVADGATLVWQGQLSTTNVSGSWAEITLTQPFVLPAGMHLQLYWHHECGCYLSGYWRYTAKANSTTWGSSDASWTAAKAATNSQMDRRANIRLTISSGMTDSNSVKIESLISPQATTSAGQYDYKVVIRNMGIDTLKSCNITYTLNGGTPVTYAWTGGTLLSTYMDTITLSGTYTGVAGKVDELVVVVDSPNGKQDPNTDDDTLTTYITVCGGAMSGTYTMGTASTDDFSGVANFLRAIKNCGISGKVELEVQDGTYDEPINLLSIKDVLTAADTLIIKSASGNAADVTFVVSEGSVVTFNGNRNVYVQNLTLDALAGENGVLLSGVCQNMEVSGCTIKVSPTATTQSAGCGITYSGFASVTGMGSLRVLNNTIQGGYAGLYLVRYNGEGNSMGSTSARISVMGNTIENSYYAAIYSNLYTRFDTIGYNTIATKANVSTEQYGFHLGEYSRADAIIGNKMNLRANSGANDQYGMRMRNLNEEGTPALLIANNEIRKLGAASNFYGLYMHYAKIKFVHNTVYAAGNGTNHLIYIYTKTTGSTLRATNNILAAVGTGVNYVVSGRDIDDVKTPMFFDYNDYYTVGGNFSVMTNSVINMPTFADWLLRTGQDTHSVFLMPALADVTTDLSLSSGGTILCPTDADVPTDIIGVVRSTKTSMGCYEAPFLTGNATLYAMQDLQTGYILGERDSLYVTVMNTGTTPLSSVGLAWSHNGTNYPSVDYPVSLNLGETAVLNLGAFLYVAGINEVEAWITQINLDSIPDEEPLDNMLSTKSLVCPLAPDGYLTVGYGGMFANIPSALDALNACGVSSDITFALMPGAYGNTLPLTNNATLFGNFKFTITSYSGDAEDVTLSSLIEFNNSKNIELNAVTMGSYSQTVTPVKFTGAASDITIRNCRVLVDTTTTSTSANVIQKAGSTGIANNITIVNNEIVGGYDGFVFNAGTGTSAYGNNIVFDSNTLKNQYHYGADILYAHMTSCSYNTAIGRLANESSGWRGLSIRNANGPIIGNRIAVRKAILMGTSLYVERHNFYLAGGKQGLIANNEVIADYIGLQLTTSHSNVINNSIYIKGSSFGSRGIHIANSTDNLLNIHNNIIVTNGTTNPYPIYFSATGNLPNYTFVNNDLYSMTNGNMGYYGAVLNSGNWASTLGDATSVNVDPNFADVTQNLELSAYPTNLLVPAHADVKTDITGLYRMATTAMGAYAQPLSSRDLGLLSITPWSVNCVINQPMSVSVEVINSGGVAIDDVTLEWKLNSASQGTVLYTFPTPLASMTKAFIPVGGFTATAGSPFDVEVWIVNINGSGNDTIKWNDTVRAHANAPVSLLSWAMPYTEDTVEANTFDVFATIQTFSGAPQTPPYLVYTVHKDGVAITDSVAMVQVDALTWKGTVPEQYYYSDVAYSLTIRDASNAVATVRDTTYLRYGNVFEEVQVGNGLTSGIFNPLRTDYRYSWTRQLYLASEVNPEGRKIEVTKVYFDVDLTGTRLPYTYTNQTMYMKAVSDNSITTLAYEDPNTTGGMLVWTGNLAILADGWIEITLDRPFPMMPNENLMIYYEHKHAILNPGGVGGSPAFRTHATTNMAICREDDNRFPNPLIYGAIHPRPNAKFEVKKPSPGYAGHNLALLEALYPVENSGIKCAQLYSPLTVRVANMGTMDYDFTVDTVKLHIAVSTPMGTIDTITYTLDSGISYVGDFYTIDITDNYPIMTAGTYGFSVWIESSVDALDYDDTLTYSYTPVSVGLPIDEDFSTGIPTYCDVNPLLGSNAWTATPVGLGTDAGIVLPASGQMMAFEGNKGDMTRLETHQIDIFNTYHPVFSMWYYHDTAPCADYTDVYVTTDGGNTFQTILSLVKGQPGWYEPEWVQYNIDLTPYQSASCFYIVIEAMRKSNSVSTQYIDRFRIQAGNNLLVGDILMDSITLCNMADQHEVKVVLSNVTAQAIDFANDATKLHVEVRGEITRDTVIDFASGIFAGMTSDTIRLWNDLSFVQGTYSITAYIDAINNIEHDDTTSIDFVLSPSLDVALTANTSIGACTWPNTAFAQEVTLVNDGNMDFEDLLLTLVMEDANGTPITLVDTLTGGITVGSSVTHQFDKTYLVPEEGDAYYIRISVTPLCGGSLAFEDRIDECISQEDLILTELLAPVTGVMQYYGDSVFVKVKVKNIDPLNNFTNVVLWAAIDENAVVSQTVDKVESGEEVEVTFTQPYIVPSVASYTLTVYAETQDGNPSNDTLFNIYSAELKDTNALIDYDVNAPYLSQNIPNPARNTTRVNYSIPTDGTVIFHVYTVTGQTLMTRSIEAVSGGVQNIDFDITGLATGIYYYSMDYNGRKIVKKMNVAR